MTTETQSKPAQKSMKPIDEVKQTLMSDGMKKQFAMALPPQIPLERFVRVAMTAMSGKTGEDLLQCTRESLYGALMGAAQDGLLPDGREAAIVKFGNVAQYMPMAKGILKKVRNSGELGMFHVEVIYKNDEFSYHVDENGPHLFHKPEVLGVKGDMIGVYAIAKTKDGEAYIEVMSDEEVEQVRQISRAKDSGPWKQWRGEMAKKTVIRRLSKRLPMSTDLDDLIRRDDHLHDVEATVKDTETKGKKGEPNRLQKMLGDTLEGVGRETGSEEAQPEEDPEAAAAEREKVAARHRELEAQKNKLKNTPSKEEQAEIARKEAFDALEFKCAKCPPYTFSTDSEEEMTVHWQTKHPAPPKEQKKTNGGKADDGDIFGAPK